MTLSKEHPLADVIDRIAQQLGTVEITGLGHACYDGWTGERCHDCPATVNGEEGTLRYNWQTRTADFDRA